MAAGLFQLSTGLKVALLEAGVKERDGNLRDKDLPVLIEVFGGSSLCAFSSLSSPERQGKVFVTALERAACVLGRPGFLQMSNNRAKIEISSSACPERLQRLHLWRVSRPDRIKL